MPLHRKTTPIYLGIDPGASGGLAYLNGEVLMADKMPATDKDIWDYFVSVSWCLGRPAGQQPRRVVAVIEEVSGYVGEDQPGSRAFKFGASYGKLLMALAASGVPYEVVRPAKWQKALSVPPRKKGGNGAAEESKTAFKNRLKAKAQALYPETKVTLAVADAILIAYYCKLWHEGKVKR